MTRIVIKDISEDKKMSAEELRKVMGGRAIQTGMFQTGQVSLPDIGLVSLCCCIYRNVDTFTNRFP